MSMKIVGYKRDGQNFTPIYEQVGDNTIRQEELLARIKEETHAFFESTSAYIFGFDETSTKAYEKGAMMVYNILFPT